MTYTTQLSDGAIDALLAHEGRGRTSAWQRSARGNLWRRWGVFRVVVFRCEGRYGWLIVHHRPTGTPAFCPTTYAAEEEAMQAATDAVTAMTTPRRGVVQPTEDRR